MIKFQKNKEITKMAENKINQLIRQIAKRAEKLEGNYII